MYIRSYKVTQGHADCCYSSCLELITALTAHFINFDGARLTITTLGFGDKPVFAG